MIAFADPGRKPCCAVSACNAPCSTDADRWEGIRVRIGIHVGPSVRRGDDLFGRNVAMAARVAGQADGW